MYGPYNMVKITKSKLNDTNIMNKEKSLIYTPPYYNY